ncbi:MAG: hypothetical protein ACJ71J_02360 [Nitrososphaeraceae archaeon]
MLGSSLSNSTRRKKEKAMMVVWSQMEWSSNSRNSTSSHRNNNSNHRHYHSNIG